MVLLMANTIGLSVVSNAVMRHISVSAHSTDTHRKNLFFICNCIGSDDVPLLFVEFTGGTYLCELPEKE